MLHGGEPPTEWIRSRTPSRLRELIETLPDNDRIRPLLLTRLNLLLADISAETNAANLVAQKRVIRLTYFLCVLTVALMVAAVAQVIVAFQQLQDARAFNKAQQQSNANKTVNAKTHP